jgi:Flp pilus assembly pilin Flp
MIDTTSQPLTAALQEARGKQRGQGLVEYALILALVAIVTIITLQLVGGAIGQTLEEAWCSLGGADRFYLEADDSDYTLGSGGELILNANATRYVDPYCVRITARSGATGGAPTLTFTAAGNPFDQGVAGQTEN